MKDGLGSRISKGNLLFHVNEKRVYQVVDVDDGGVIADTPPSLTLQLKVAVNMPKGERGEPVLSEFVRVVNPAEEAALDRALAAPRQ